MNQRTNFGAMLMRCTGKLLMCTVALGTVCFEAQSKSADDEYIQERVREEIRRQMSGGSSNSELRNKIQKNVYQELKNSGFKEKKQHKKRSKTRKNSNDEPYLLPQWPHYSLFYSRGDFMQLSADFSMASQAYNSDGKTRDFSALLFGSESIAVQDVLLVAKLSLGNKVSMGPVDFWKDVAATNFLFDAWEHRFGVGLNLARHFCNNDLSFGVHIPVVGKTHRVRLKNGTTDLPAAHLADIQAAYPDLGDTYGDLLVAIMNAKNSSFNDRSTTQVGLGDIDGYLNLVIRSRHIDRFVIGTQVIFPSAREADVNTLWGHDLGNGGFVQWAGFFSMLWEKCNWFNPYFHLKGTYGFAARVTRRVPRRLQEGLAGTALTNGSCDFVLGKNLVYANPAAPFNELDSAAKRFADNVRKIKIHPGSELLLRIGNAFTGVGKGGALDIHYDLKIKGRDYLGSRRGLEDIYDGSVLNIGSWSVGHIIGGQYSYQFDNMFRIGGGVAYAVAGRNYPKELTFHLDFNYEF